MTTRRIGILDDEPEFIEEIITEFEDQKQPGMELLCTDDPDVALKWVVEKKIELLVSDKIMEKKDGILLLQEARQVDSDIILVSLTGFVVNSEESEILNSINATYLEKEHGNKNIINDILSLVVNNKNFLSHTEDKFPQNYKQLLKIKELIYDKEAQQLINELDVIEDKENIVFIGSDSITISNLIIELKNASSLGVKYVSTWMNAKNTLKKLGH